MNNTPLNGAALNGSGQFIQYAPEVLPVVFTLHFPHPSRRWSVSGSRIHQTIYLCSLGDLSLPISSFQARLRDGAPTYLSVVVTARDGLMEELQERSSETLVLRSGVRLASGEEITEPLVIAGLDSIRYQLGGRAGSYTLTGYTVQTTTVSKVVPIAGVSSIGLQADGKRTCRAEPSFFLRPGDVARIPGQADMVVGMIALAVNPRAASMDITER